MWQGNEEHLVFMPYSEPSETDGPNRSGFMALRMLLWSLVGMNSVFHGCVMISLAYTFSFTLSFIAALKRSKSVVFLKL